MTEKAVLLFHFEAGNVLLIEKLRGLGQGKINAPGGRVESGESWSEAAIRETAEETGRVVTGLTLVARLDFTFVTGYHLDVRVFFSDRGHGALRPCDEAIPFWCPVTALPWARMWRDDALWLPPSLAGQGVNARFLFDKDEMLRADCNIVDRSLVPIDG